MHAKFCTIPCNRIRDRNITRIWGKRKISVLYSTICIHIASLLIPITLRTLHTFFVRFHPIETKISLLKKIRKKCAYSATDNSFMKFCTLVLELHLPQIFVTRTQRERQTEGRTNIFLNKNPPLFFNWTYSSNYFMQQIEIS